MDSTHFPSMARQVLLRPGVESGWIATCPSLPGCVSQGKSKVEAIANIREAIQAYVAGLQDVLGHLWVAPSSNL